MNGIKYLLKNVTYLTIGQLGSKILIFLLLPLYTNVLTTEEYGTYDLVNMTIILLIPILTIDLRDAVLRFSIDNKKNRDEIFSVGVVSTVIGTVLCTAIFSILAIANVTDVISDYYIYIILMFVANAFVTLLMNFARGLDCVKEVSISGIICSIFMLALNLLTLLVFKMGLHGYFISNIASIFIQCLYLFISTKSWTFIKPSSIKYLTFKKMREYSIPLILNDISWWVINLSDRYVVSWIQGINANGIYAASNKIPSVISTFQGIFNQAWTLSAVKDFDTKDKNSFFILVYNSYNVLLVVISSILICINIPLSRILFANEFFEAWTCVPYLTIAAVFGGLSGFLGGIFTAVKDTRIFAKTTAIMALVNILLSIVLVNYIGIIGAAIATLLSYIVVWALRVRYSTKYIDIKFSLLKDSSLYILLIFQGTIMLFLEEGVMLYSIQISLFLIIAVICCFTLKKLYKECRVCFNKKNAN